MTIGFGSIHHKEIFNERWWHDIMQFDPHGRSPNSPPRPVDHTGPVVWVRHGTRR
jgi:hypothetical protein